MNAYFDKFMITLKQFKEKKKKLVHSQTLGTKVVK